MRTGKDKERKAKLDRRLVLRRGQLAGGLDFLPFERIRLDAIDDDTSQQQSRKKDRTGCNAVRTEDPEVVVVVAVVL